MGIDKRVHQSTLKGMLMIAILWLLWWRDMFIVKRVSILKKRTMKIG